MKEERSKIIFVNRPYERDAYHYCYLCFYNGKDKKEKLDKHPKPDNTKCYNGAGGFYMQFE